MNLANGLRKIRHEHLFVFLAIPYALTMLCLTPPFQVPDEQSHFFRSYMLAEGKILEDRLENGTGGSVPESLVKAWHVSTGDLNIRFQPDARVDPESMKQAWDLPLNRNDRIVVDVGRNRSPFLYLPQATGIKLGLFFDAKPIALLYMGRIAAFIFWAALCFHAIRTTPVLKSAFLLLALTPMSVFLACSVSHDVVTNCTAFLYIAYVFKLAFESEKIRKKEFVALLAFSFFLPLTKPFYFLCLLAAIIPVSKFENKKDWAFKLASVFSVYFATIWLWKEFKSFYYSTINARIYENIQLFHHAVSANNQGSGSDFAEFTTLFLQSIVYSGPFYLQSFVANLGWLDTSFPDWYIAAMFLAIIALSLFNDETKTVAIDRRVKLYCLFFFLLFFAGAHLHTYLYDGFFSNENEKHILGIQGRYFIPLSVLPFLWLHNENRTFVKIGRYNKALLIFVVFFSVTLTFIVLKNRYFTGS